MTIGENVLDQGIVGASAALGDAADRIGGMGGHVLAGGAPDLYRRIARGLRVSDALCLISALGLSYVSRYGLQPRPDFFLIILTMPMIWLSVFHTFSLYSPQNLSAFEEFRRTVAATAVALVLIALASYWSNASLSRKWIGLAWLLAMSLEQLTRSRWRRHVEALRCQGKLAFRTLIVGTNLEAERLATELTNPELGYLPVCHIATSEAGSKVHLPVAGRIPQLIDVIHDFAIDCLFVASSAVDDKDMLQVIRATRHQELDLRVSANLPQVLTTRPMLQPHGRMMAIALKPVRLSGAQSLAKRSFDLVVAGTALLITFPVWLVIAALIKISSPGPVLFRQRRVTKGGQVFEMLKFRTMAVDAEEFVVREQGIDLATPFFKLQDDPRVFRVGHLLRRLSLDELPQLLNVVRGEMSVVGPRPLPTEQVAANLDLLGPRHEVPAGVTGWWQVQGRSKIDDPEEAVRLDLFYIENWSLALDFFIVLRTLRAVLSRAGAY